MESDAVDSAVTGEPITGINDNSSLSQVYSINKYGQLVKMESFSDSSSNTIDVDQAPEPVGGSCRVRTPAVNVSSMVVSSSVNNTLFPVKLVVTADALNSKMKSGTLRLSPGTAVKGSQPTLMCVANSLPSVVNKVNKVSLVPAQNLTFVANSSPKKVAVISVPVKQPPLSRSVIQPDLKTANSLKVDLTVHDGPVIDLVDSPVKVEVSSESKNLQLVSLNPVPVQPFHSELQTLTHLPKQPTSSLLSQTSTVSGPAASQVKFVKLLTVPSYHDTVKNSSNKAFLKSTSSSSSVHLIIPPRKTVCTSQAVSSTPIAYLPLTQAKVPLPKRTILPSPWKPACNQKVSADELKSAVAHMTKQAALTIIDIQRQSSTSSLGKASSSPAASRKSKDSSNDVNSGADRARRPCNCSKSQCLKLYCECFSNGEFCSDCNCFNCANNLKHEDDRQRAIRACLERNPYAFHPKIGKSRGDSSRQHSKGCHCKRSSCLKNYCECYEAKILCTDLCKCFGCKNLESNMTSHKLQYLADAADKRSQQQLAAANRFDSEISYIMKPINDVNGQRPSHSFITMDVVEATNACLLATAEECIAMLHSDRVVERQILEEFGRCLEQVIDASSRSSAF